MTMRAIILAAGMGTRLRRVLGGRPKPLFEVGGMSLLEHSLTSLAVAGIREVAVVVGYEGGAIRQTLANVAGGLALEVVENRLYGTTGSMHSLHLALPRPQECLVLDGDIVYSPEILTRLLGSRDEDVVALAECSGSGDEVYVTLDEKGTVSHLGKTHPDGGTVLEFTGIAKFSVPFLESLILLHEENFRNGIQGEYWEDCAFRAARLQPWYGLFTPLPWSEVDKEADVPRAERVLREIGRTHPHLRAGAGKIEFGLMHTPMTPVKRNILLNPGPATTTDTVKYAQVVPDICPREAEFTALLARIGLALVRIAESTEDEHAAVLFGGSGTAVMDAVVNSMVPAAGKLAIVDNGAYGRRLVQIARSYGIAPAVISLPWTVPVTPAMVRKVLAEDRAITGLTMVHHETTTGLVNPVAEIGPVAAEFGCLFAVDGISSFAGMPLDVRGAGIDFLLSTSNKCLQGMPGVAFVIASRTALERIRDYPRRSYYLNLYDQHTSLQRTGEMRFTAPVQCFYALEQAIREFKAEGAVARHKRYADCSVCLRAGLRELGFSLLLDDAVASTMMTTVVEPAHPLWRFSTVHDELYRRGFTIYPGKLSAARTFRLANIGAITLDDIRAFLAALRDVLTGMGLKREDLH